MMMAVERDNPSTGARRAVVVGLGETGLACARHLAAAGHRVGVIDTRERPPLAAELAREHPEIPRACGALDQRMLCEADFIVLSPGLDPRVPEIAAAREAGVPVIGEIELFARAASAPVIAITGSNGKSTVTTLVAAMLVEGGLDVAAGGNLGPSALSLLERDTEPDCYVLELSSFQLETVSSLAPAASVVLNISADHLDRYRDLDDYAATKARIHERSAAVVINRDDPRVAAMGRPGDRGFTLGAPADGDWGVVEGWFSRGDERCCPLASLALPGRHNRANALAALALADAVGVPWEAMARALTGYRGLPHRMAPVGRFRGRVFYDDSKGTNVGATVAAVSGVESPLVLIAGGRGKGQDFRPLAGALRGRARAVVVLGEDAATVAAAVEGVCPVHHARDMAEAVVLAVTAAQSGDAVVLSPACASQDMYTDYAARGEDFRRQVEGLGDD
ncbi:UDP-N-acetylmuramoyl-L-alanine--D-glutamate ligase [Arhodomonas sp. SL1]|uniref:UDP-N-acetylmuramoyl-L-alanine--D-glutamate ligase n=1 Tax=Arhodomonas sp. SL1 TaxID=3425691 RepID=UPI003F88393D